MNTRLAAFALPLALAAALLGSCGSKPKGSVSEKELAAVKESSHSIAPGMKKSAVLPTFEKNGANVVRLSSTQLDGATIEEWKTEAFNDSKKGRDLSVQFLYFRNDVLVDLSESRIDFRNDAALTKRWASEN